MKAVLLAALLGCSSSRSPAPREPVVNNRVEVPPRASDPEIDPTKSSLVLEITNDTIVVNGEQLRDDQIEHLFRAAYARDHATQVILEADPSVAHGRVVHLMELAKAAGLQRLAIGTK